MPKVLLQLAQRDAAQVDVVKIVGGKKVLVAQGRFVVGNGVAELGLVFAVEHQRNAEFGGHFGRQLLLAQNEGLERVEQHLGGNARQKPVRYAVGRAQVVVKPGVNPRLKVLPAPGRVHVRRPGDGERVHAVFVLQQVRGVKAVLAAAARHQAVVAAVGLAVARRTARAAAPRGRPSRSGHLLVAAGVAGVAHAVRLDDHGLFLRAGRVLKLIAAVRASGCSSRTLCRTAPAGAGHNRPHALPAGMSGAYFA